MPWPHPVIRITSELANRLGRSPNKPDILKYLCDQQIKLVPVIIGADLCLIFCSFYGFLFNSG